MVPSHEGADATPIAKPDVPLRIRKSIADGILDRLVHNAHRIEMRGESMRKKRNPPQDERKE